MPKRCSVRPTHEGNFVRSRAVIHLDRVSACRRIITIATVLLLLYLPKLGPMGYADDNHDYR